MNTEERLERIENGIRYLLRWKLAMGNLPFHPDRPPEEVDKLVEYVLRGSKNPSKPGGVG